MKVICVDDEQYILEHMVNMCAKLDDIDEVTGFKSAKEVLSYFDAHKADIALLDIDMPDMSGMELAEAIKAKNPDISIIFVTVYSEYAVEAFSMHVSGYLLKPVSKDKLEKEIQYAIMNKENIDNQHIAVRTFGNFDVMVDGRAISFARSKSKELLAFLVDKRGSGVSRSEAFTALYDNAEYDRPMQKQFDVIIRSLRDTLKENGISHIFDINSGFMRVYPEKFVCDIYQVLEGDRDVLNSYKGEYMSGYSWGYNTEAYLSNIIYK